MNEQVKRVLDTYVDIITSVEGVLQVYLFGSYAYGTPHEQSDLDLMVIVDDEHKAINKSLEIHKNVSGKSVFPVDILVNRAFDFANAQNDPTLQRRIKEEGVLLYAK